MGLNKKWNFSRKGSKFEEDVKGRETIFQKIVGYPELNDVLGESWLDSQKENYYFPFLHQRLSALNVAVSKVRNLKGYKAWVSNITSNPKDFESYEFEILEISRLADIADQIKIYPSIEKEGYEYESLSELKMLRHGIEFYVEMTKFREISNPKNKIKKLIEKGRKQIPKNSSGFIFVDISDVAIEEKCYVKSGEIFYDIEINDEFIMKEVEQFFRGQNTRVLGILFIIFYLSADKDYNVGVITRYCPIINRYNKLCLDNNQIEKLIFSDKYLNSKK